MYIYIICPVRNVTEEQTNAVVAYVLGLEAQGNFVHFPSRDVNQDDPTGYNIVFDHLRAMEKADEVHIFWDINSKGSPFDLGMAIALKKTLVLVKSFVPEVEGKSYLKVIMGIMADQY